MKTIYRKIFLLILCVSLIPAALAIFHSYWGSIVLMDSTMGEYMQERSKALATQFSSVLEENISDFLSIKSSPEVRKLAIQAVETEIDKREVQDIFVKMLTKTTLEYYGIEISNMAGEPLVSYNITPSVNWAQKGWWKEAQQLETEAVYVTNIWDPLQRKFQLVLISPVYREQLEQRGPIAMLIALGQFPLLMRSLSVEQATDFTQIFIYSDKGYILFPFGVSLPIQDDLIKSFSTYSPFLGWFSKELADKKKQLFSYACIDAIRTRAKNRQGDSNWYVIQGVDLSDFVTFFNMAFWQVALVSFSVVIVLCFLGLYMARRMVMPLKRLNWAVQEIASGTLDSKIKVMGSDEISTLAENFNKMVDKLRLSHEVLNKKLKELNEKAHQISLIYEITKSINTALDIEETYNLIADEIRKLVDYDRASITVLDPSDNTVQFEFVRPVSRLGLQKGDKLSLEHSNIGRAIRDERPVIKQDLLKEAEAIEDDLLIKVGMRSIIVVPLISKSGVIGTFNLGSKYVGYYGEKEQQLLTQISEALAVAIQHSRLYTRISRFAEELEDRVKERTQELELAQSKLIQTEKFAATGRLAASVAHEINNPLGIIKNYLRMVRDEIDKLKQPGEALPINERNLDIISEELGRIARIIRSLLDFYRPSDGKLVSVDVNEELRQIVSLMERGFAKRRLKVLMDLSPELPACESSPDLLRQVFLNILKNAEDAIEAEGEIKIRTYLDQEGLGRGEAKKIVVTISDTGCGIPEEDLNRIFDPFFTTKEEDKAGTGLGLSVTYSILQRLGGSIDIQSKVGEGTTVKIEFPV